MKNFFIFYVLAVLLLPYSSIKDVRTSMDKQNKSFYELINIFPEKIKSFIFNLPNEIKNKIEEIRIRIGTYSCIIYEKKIIPIKIAITRNDLDEIFKNLCKNSFYSFEEELKQGFITFKGGHRVGIASSVTYENGIITGIKDIISFNIRICKEFKGCSDEIFNIIKEKPQSILIAGAPSSGKTTLLRDLARKISKNKKVTIIDERYEIAACFDGELNMDIGASDVISGIPKHIGILRAIRCLSPEVIICDEIGDINESKLIKQALNSGVKIIASIHAENENEILKKPQIRSLLSTKAFEKIIILDSLNVGKIYKVMEVNEVSNDNSKNFRDYFFDSFRNFVGDVYFSSKP